jgi:8-oxo-dGTP pyrophosphatase MutT (NUDIX family)/phosphohistidine phosphatase SixA
VADFTPKAPGGSTTVNSNSSTVVAAGAVCWRTVNGDAEVLVVHREERADISLPKGKVDPGETPPQTAVREVAEETGLTIILGATLGTIEYSLPGGRTKIVYYWVAEIDGDTLSTPFMPNNEISKIEWLTVPEARAKLSYDRDRDVLDRFSERVAKNTSRTFAIIALRHGKALPPEIWDGPDATRPLLDRGIAQVTGIAPAIAAWQPAKLISSTATRCLATIEPIALMLGLPVKQSAAISQDAYEGGADKVKKIVAKRINRRRTAVLCSHGPVLPAIIRELIIQTNTPMTEELRMAGMLTTGNYVVVHLSSENPTAGIVAIETHGPVGR